jgi:hypothetical protein
VPGLYGFVAQLNEGRYSKKRPTEFRVDQVVQPFDPAKFNFTKVWRRCGGARCVCAICAACVPWLPAWRAHSGGLPRRSQAPQQRTRACAPPPPPDDRP